MTRDEITRIAKEAGLEQDGDNFFSSKSDPQVDVHITDLEAFATLVASAEREACAELADMAVDFWVKGGFPECAEVREAMNISEAIRARGNT